MSQPYNIRMPSGLVIARVWFSWLWRTFLWLIVAMIVAFIFAVIIGFAFGVAGIDQQTTKLVFGPLGLAIGAAAGFWAQYKAFKQVLGKNYSGLRLVFIDTQPNASGMYENYGNGH